MASTYMGEFEQDVKIFNDMFKMPISNGYDPVRLRKFVSILQEELNEYEDINDSVQLADWLGDIIVYCASELLRHNISPGAVVCCIMDSNGSKMGPDGQPVFDARGKLLKGPHFQPPEPLIAEYLTHYKIGEDDLDTRYTFRDNIEVAGCEQETEEPSPFFKERIEDCE